MIKIKKGDYKRIAFGEDFDALPIEHKQRYLIELCSSQNRALELMQEERDALLDEVALMTEKIINAEKNVEINKSTLIEAITSNNEREQQYIKDIQALQNRVKVQDELIESYGG